ncbi:MAG: cyanophycin synthetase, partial [Myxococcota bacterium]|nr:cyanophycin synthetase [Myxococcota bacterium]
AAGADPALLPASYESFPPPKGRLETVASHDGVRWIYDIQATTAPAAAAGIHAVAPTTGQLILVVGGEDKGMDYQGMADAAAQSRCTILALPGSGTEALLSALDGRCDVSHLDDLDQAIERAGDLAEDGGVVLLSPGCAFFHSRYIDGGASFAQRVRVFLGEPIP